MQESFWWWQCSDRYIISLSPHLHPPPPLNFSPSLISLMVSVDVKHRAYVLRLRVLGQNQLSRDGFFFFFSAPLPSLSLLSTSLWGFFSSSEEYAFVHYNTLFMHALRLLYITQLHLNMVVSCPFDTNTHYWHILIIMSMGVIYTYVGNIKIAFAVIFTCVHSCVTVCVNVPERVPVCIF